MPSIILDILNVVDSITSQPDEDTKDRMNFCAIVKECEKVSYIFLLFIKLSFSEDYFKRS